MAIPSASPTRPGLRSRAAGIRPGRGRRDPVVLLADRLAAAAAAGAAAGGVALAARRLAGGFVDPSSAAAWLVVAVGVALVALSDASASLGTGGGRAPLLARVGLACGVIAVALPPRAGDWTTWLALAVALVAVTAPRAARGTSGRRRREVRAVVPATRPVSSPEPNGPRGPAVPGGRLLQRLERFEHPPGVDCVRGRVQVEIPAGAKAAHGHVGFCPAFSQTPSVTVTTDYDGVEAVVSAAELLPWGVRVEVRLAEPAEETLEIPVDVTAQAPR